MTGRVTAVVSAYHAEEYLDGRLTNLLEQDEKPEIIVVCRLTSEEHNIASKYDVTIITTPDIPGVYEAWNIAIKQASGKYITNANCDDRLYPGALKKMADILDKETTYGLVYADQDIVEKIDAEPIGKFTWLEGGMQKLLEACFLGPMPMWRKSLHDRFGYFDEFYKSAGDYEFWLRLMKGGVKFYHVRGDTIGAYLRRQNSIEHREPLRSLWEAANIRMKYREVANA